jgi:polyisoprenyl-phosphate glycosyltransferase
VIPNTDRAATGERLHSAGGEIELSVVVPVYNEEASIGPFLSRVVPIVEQAVSTYELIFCVDPSSDATEQVLIEARRTNPRIKYVVFSRRFGQPAAVIAGVDLAAGRAVIVIDVDLQDPPELIPEMLRMWRDGYDVVYGQRTGRHGETIAKRVVSALGYRLISRLSDVEIPPHTGDFRLMDRRVVERLRDLPESHGFLRGLVALVGYRQGPVTFERSARYAGRGKYNRFFGSLKIGLNGLIGFSSALLDLSTFLGLLAAVGAFMLAAAYAGFKFAGVHLPVGNPTIVVLVLLIGGMQLICLGIAGQYLGRIYEEVKRRPRYIVDRAEGLPADGPSRAGPSPSPSPGGARTAPRS